MAPRLCGVTVLLVAWVLRAGLVLADYRGAARLAALVLVTQHLHMLRVSGDPAHYDTICSMALLMQVASERLWPCSDLV